ncbi:MAG TPA: hypothetical protein VK578_09370 [Edaphobacter sp.]|nr:hypothetical protein [Edaphobacter sp.]
MTLPRAILTLSASLAILFSYRAAPAQSDTNPGSTTQCGVYAEAYKTGTGGYTPFLNFTSDIARTRDKHDSNKRYTKALQDSAPAANALWLNNWCTRNPLKTFAEASNHLLDELTGQASDSDAKLPGAHNNKRSITHSLVIMLNGEPVPNSCRVGSTKYCSGCSVACPEGQSPKCMEGTDSFNGPSCFQSSVCRCK